MLLVRQLSRLITLLSPAVDQAVLIPVTMRSAQVEAQAVIALRRAHPAAVDQLKAYRLSL
jgi:hypothetical protein